MFFNTEGSAEATYDAIVVGSGISGGWAAKELCEKGLKTLVLERGRQVEHIKDYPTMNMNPWDLPYRDDVPKDEIDKDYPKQSRTGYTVRQGWKHFFVKDSEHPYGEDAETRFDWIRGYHVGGRSLVWGRQSYRLSDLDFEANGKEGIGVDWPIRYKDLAPWYSYVERFVGVSGANEGLPQLPDGEFQPPMEFNCLEKQVKERLEAKYKDRKLTIGRTAHLTAPTEEQKKLGRGQCQSRNLCMRGCPYGAYFSSNSATLPAAMATGNLTLRPFSIVHSVIYDEATGTAKGVRVIDTETKETHEFFAKVIFLCASAIPTTSILMNSVSDRFPNGMGNDSGELGHNIMDHHFQVGARGASEDFGDMYYIGRRPNGIYIPRFRNVSAATKQKDFIRGYGYQGGAGREGWGAAASKPGFGVSLKESVMNPGPWSINFLGFGEILPYHDNYMKFNATEKDQWGLPTVTFHTKIRENELAMRKDMMNQASEMLEAVGIKDIEPYDNSYGIGLGIHEMGTARMGRDPKTSVLNANNQVHGVPNVFVTDGACMTSAGCQNPSLTYMALTARAVDFAVKALKDGKLVG